MKRRTLLEFSAPSTQIIEEKFDEVTRERVMRVAVKWSHADVINSNRRLYPRVVLEREIERLQPQLLMGSVYGASFHPFGDADVDDVSHIWESIAMEEDGSCVGIVKIVPTDRGRNAQTLIKYGGHIGLSTRGYGTTTTKKKLVDGEEIEFEEINDDFVLKSPGDFVLTPSVPDAGVRRVLESKMDDLENLPGDGKEIALKKTIEELRAEFPEAFVALDESMAALQESLSTAQADVASKATRISELEVELDEAKKAIEAKDAKLADNQKLFKTLGPILREFDRLPEDDLGGEDEGGEGEGEVEGSGEGEGEGEGAEEAEALRRENEELKARLVAIEQNAHTAAKQKEIDEAIAKALDEAEGLDADDRPLVEKRIERPETADAAVEAVVKARARLAEDRSELLKDKIRESGLGGKGIVGNPDENGTQLTADQLSRRYREARKAGFKGTLEQYTKGVLGVKD